MFSMRSILKIVAAGVFATLFGNAASAADIRQLPPPSMTPPLLESAPLLVDEFSSGWYLRGDIGYRFNEVDSVTNVGGPAAVRREELDNSWVAGLGVGYKWGWVRADLTVDYGSRAGFTADSGTDRNDFTAKIDSITGLVNLYGDLGTWFGLTPYIGAGVGFASLHVTNFTGQGGGPTGQDSSTNFAWAYMAGLNYQIAHNYSIDVGYRHVNMGDAITGRDGRDNQLMFKKLSADEIRVGFRYTLD
jgi:opacity protein-like surface antigen